MNVPRDLKVMLTLLFLAMGASPSSAHGIGKGGNTTGISIPSLGHGEMAVLAPYQRAIMDLALSALDTNEPFRRVLNYAQIQYAYCLWGAMPGTISDEESPFNECAHAYLAATKAVLLDMRSMPGEAKRANMLASQLDEDLVRSGLGLVLCQFSGESFNTAELIRPRLIGILAHPASGSASLAFLATMTAGAWGGARLLRRNRQRPSR